MKGFYVAYNQGWIVGQSRNHNRLVWRSASEDKSVTSDGYLQASWLADRLNEYVLSVQAVLASHHTRHSRRRALRRYALELLREWRR